MLNLIPYHVGIMMDGNRRWAKNNNLSIKKGHETGYYTLKKIVDFAGKKGIKVLTVYAFSTENWNRPQIQVLDMLDLMTNSINETIQELHENNAVFRVIGDISRFPKKLQKKLCDGVKITGNNTGLILNVALNYGGRDEIVRAVNKLNDEGSKINENTISKALDTSNQPDPDLIIRTGGAKRISNFLIWQSSYSEIIFIDDYWPEFSAEKFNKLLEDYSKRERRFGK